MRLIDQPMPIALAVQRLGDKHPVASRLRTAQWATVPLGLRERAQFSAAVDSVEVVSAIQEKLLEWARLGKENPERAFMDRGRFVAEMRDVVRQAGLDTGVDSLTNPAAQQRLRLIYDFQTTDAAAYAGWKQGQAPEVLDRWPCQELVRVEARMKERDWRRRWTEAGGRLFGGRMIARKDDGVWLRISRFGRPFPPYDFGSGMGIEDVTRDEAERLGVIARGVTVAPTEAAFNDKLTASIRKPGQRRALARAFGGQVEETPVGLKWTGQLHRMWDVVELDAQMRGVDRAALNAAKDALTQAHGVSAGVPRVRVEAVKQLGDALGGYWPREPWRAGYIKILEPGTREDTPFSLLHEVGHFLDDTLWGQAPSFGRPVQLGTDLGHVELAAVQRVIAASAPIQALRAIRPRVSGEALDRVDYLLEPREQLARAYAQWVAQESGHPLMLKGLAARRQRGDVSQWTDEDFVPIAAAFRAVFGRLTATERRRGAGSPSK